MLKLWRRRSRYTSLGTDGRFLRFRPQNPIGVAVVTRGGTWGLCDVCIKAERSREEPVAIGCLNLKLDHYAPRVSGSAKIFKDVLELCNSSINKIEIAPTRYLSSYHI
jgi:hypothetical protein